MRSQAAPLTGNNEDNDITEEEKPGHLQHKPRPSKYLGLRLSAAGRCTKAGPRRNVSHACVLVAVYRLASRSHGLRQHGCHLGEPCAACARLPQTRTWLRCCQSTPPRVVVQASDAAQCGGGEELYISPAKRGPAPRNLERGRRKTSKEPERST